MNTKIWAIVIGVILLVCVGLSAFLMQPGHTADRVEIWSEGELKYTLSLKVDQTLTIKSTNGSNTVTIRDGAVAVTEADCPDHYCMRRGFCSGGSEIVCLPNRLVIRFVGEQEIDAAVG